MVRIEFDGKHCAGHALCASTAPEVYELDDDGFCENQPSTVAESLRAAAIAGAGACPERALRIVN